MFNKVILAGNLTRDIELRFAGNNLAVVKTSIVTSKKSRGQDGQSKEEVMFIDITAFGRIAEIMNQYLRKGSKILVEGRLVFDQWVDQNNNKRSKHSVIIENMQMLGSKDANMQNNNGGYNQNQQQPQYQNQGNYGNQNNYSNNYSNSQGNSGSGYGSNRGGYSNPNQNNSNYSAPNNNSYSKPSEPPKDMEQNKPSPKESSIPEIDIDDDQVPF